MPDILLSVEVELDDAEWLKNVLRTIKNDRAARVRKAVEEAIASCDA